MLYSTLISKKARAPVGVKYKPTNLGGNRTEPGPFPFVPAPPVRYAPLNYRARAIT